MRLKNLLFVTFVFVGAPSFRATACARKIFAALSVVLILLLAGCGQKPLTRKQIHKISGEITAAAQGAAPRKPEITIRPESPRGEGTADSITISLDDDSHMKTLRQTFREIARRHGLSLAESSNDGVDLFDFAFKGVHTHAVYVVAPVAVHARSSAPPSTKSSAAVPKLAIIIDDMGSDRAAADALIALPFPLTISVIPHLPLSAATADEAYRRGDQVLLHLPMQALAADKDSEPIELRVGMSAEQVRTELNGMLETVPHAVGVNNHQGSRATSDPALMAELMPALHARGLFFIDSRTAASTVAYDAAERAKVPAASRKVFLDDTPEVAAIVAQLDLAGNEAIANGSAIAIGHPHQATIAALSETVPRLETRGIQLVYASDLVH